MKEKLLISACLLGRSCKYNGGSNYTPLVEELKKRFDLVPVCPECLGDLPIPREPSERVGDKVLSRAGADVTAAFQRGAEKALAIARREGVKRVYLAVPAFASPLTPVLNPLVGRAQWEIVVRSAAMAFFLSCIVVGALLAVPE